MTPWSLEAWDKVECGPGGHTLDQPETLVGCIGHGWWKQALDPERPQAACRAAKSPPSGHASSRRPPVRLDDSPWRSSCCSPSAGPALGGRYTSPTSRLPVGANGQAQRASEREVGALGWRGAGGRGRGTRCKKNNGKWKAVFFEVMAARQEITFVL